jgi:hypothetical protein
MNWTVAIVAILFAAAFDASFGGLLSVGELRGQLLPAVVVFVLLFAPRGAALRLAMIGGLVADLLAPAVLPSSGTLHSVLVIPGPRVLGFLLGALAVLQLRGLLYRHNPLSGAVATGIFSVLTALVFVFIWSLRGLLYDAGTPWSPAPGASEMSRRLLGALGDALVALPAIWLLGRTRPLWAFSIVTRVTPGLARAQAS